MLCRLLQDKTVLFESVSKKEVWYFKDGQVEMPRRDADQRALIRDVARADYEKDRYPWYLFYPSVENAQEPTEIMNAFTIVAASPNPKHYKQFHKCTRHKLYIPCWSWEELEKFLPHAAATVAQGKVSILLFSPR
mgnify:CR=1 FL=1